MALYWCSFFDLLQAPSIAKSVGIPLFVKNRLMEPVMPRAQMAGFIGQNCLGKIVLKKHCTENADWYFARPFVGVS
jgi:hypothetical protein